MEVREVEDHPGKLEVYLNGRIVPCNDDRDCPGAAICAWKQAWQQDPSQGMCMCNTWYGLGGANCDELSAFSTDIALMYLVPAFICIVTSVLGIMLLWRYAHYKLMLSRVRSDEHLLQSHVRPRIESLGGRLYVNPVVATLTFATLGGLLLASSCIIIVITALGFPQVYRISPETATGKMRKIVPQALDNAYALGVAFGSCFIVCSAVILPLTWVTMRAIRINRCGASLVLAYSVSFTLVTLGIELPFYALMVSNNRLTGYNRWFIAASIGWITIFGSLIILNTYALIKVRNFLSGSTGACLAPDMLAIFRRIQKACVLIIVTLSGALITSGILPLTLPLRTFYTDPKLYVDHVQLGKRAGRIFVSLLGLACVWFVILPVRNIKVAAIDAKGRHMQSLQNKTTERQSSPRISNVCVPAKRDSVDGGDPLAKQGQEAQRANALCTNAKLQHTDDDNHIEEAERVHSPGQKAVYDGGPTVQGIVVE